jgi:hypothetical protein
MPNLHTTNAEMAQVTMPNLHSIYADSAPHIKRDIEKDNKDTYTGNVCEKKFLSLWEQNPDIFTCPYTIKNKDFWNRFWNACQLSEVEIQRSMTRLVKAVRAGYYEQRFISPYPDVFVKGRMLQRGLEDFDDNGSPHSGKKNKHRIANDYVDKDDLSEYFTEA